MLRTLVHYWRMNLAVVAGVAIATTVLTGALLVGDSVRGSLRHLTLERLGAVDHALAGQRFFREELADLLAEDSRFQTRFAAVAPAILLQGSTLHVDSRARASGVGLQGVGDSFLGFFDDSSGTDQTHSSVEFFESSASAIFPPAVINESLRSALQAEVGDQILFSLKRWSDVPRGSLLGRKDTSSVIGTLRLEIVGVLQDRGIARFGLAAHQSSPFNVFVPLAVAQKALDQQGTVNSLVVAERSGLDTANASEELNQVLQNILGPEDLGLLIEELDGNLSIESQEFILKPSLIEAVESFAQQNGSQVLPVLTYLANGIHVGERHIPYSTVTGTDTGPGAFGSLLLMDGTPAPQLVDREILLNSWAAEDLGAQIGDSVEFEYFEVGPREQLVEKTASFLLRGIVRIEGLAADARLSQEYPGIAGNENMADWDPPFPIDLGDVRAIDEDYWDLYRGTPKAFLSVATGKSLWRNRWGDLTALRVEIPDGVTFTDFAEKVHGHLASELPWDLSFQPVKALGLEASIGANNYAGYFIGFSFFLIFSAAMLVVLLFGLGIEQRASEIGLRQAVGFPSARVHRQLLTEGGLLAAGGALLGLAGAIGYAGLMMIALRTWWRPAFGTSELFLHVTTPSLVTGYVLSVLVVLIAIWRRVRKLRKVPTPALLKRVSELVDTRAGKRSRWVALGALASAGLLLAFALATGETRNPAIFGAAGPLLLIGLLAAFAQRLGGSARQLERGGPGSVLRMAIANGGRNKGRSFLSTTLVAAASFMIVTVAAFHHDFSTEELGKQSGTGGFSLIGESDIPLLRDLASSDGRFELGFDDETEKLFEDATIIPLRLLPGDDTSCLNLYQPKEPRILGVPEEMVARGGFQFQSTAQEAAHPWSLLETELEPGVIPAFGDMNSTQWILKVKLGEDFEMTDGQGEPIRLRLMGTLKTSIFQSELLISKENFEGYFPNQEGSSVFMVEASEEASSEISRALETTLENYGFDAMPAVEKLAAFHAVQNTFLSTFRTLGGLGLLLGTVGLAIVLLRNVIERRGELATLRAFGFRRSTLTWLVLLENGLLLMIGLMIGTTAALITAAPHLLTAGASVPWSQIFGTLAVVLIFGILACAIASISALRIPLLPALKTEG